MAHRLAIVALSLALASCADLAGQGGGDASPGERGAGALARIQTSALHQRHAGATPAVPCEGCHEVVAGQYLRAKSWPCQKCHAQAPLGAHAAAPVDSEARECWSCHDFTSTSDRPTPCATCHAKAQGSVRAITPHDPRKPDEDCASCHRAHQQPSLVATRCESCHHEPVSGHDKPPIPITGCASCHGYHEPAEAASGRCMNCHRQSRARVPATATFAKGHVKCVTCHRQHRFLKSEVLGCRDECHQQQVAIAEDKVPQHRCLGCHDNHDVKASAPRSCDRDACHGRTIAPQHPIDPVTKTRCLGCHKPHAGRGAPLAVACSTCHHAATSDHAFHQGADGGGPQCRDCHKPHTFDLKAAGTKLCLGCHGDHPFPNAPQIRTYAKHSNCFQCHGETVRHQPTGPRVACASCHGDKAAIVAKGHATCVNCHDPHTTEQKRPCGGCHATEAATAPAAHQQCTNCHDQHTTRVKKPCAACHADRTTGVHAAVKGGCVNCHRPHGPNGPPSPPVCTTCHQHLPMLHQVSNHKDCRNCHRSHGEQPYLQRATCLACHQDRKNHEPQAVTCIACHTFGGER